MKEQQDRVITYYNSTARDYKRFWMGPDEFAAMHYGYYDPSVAGHMASLLKMNEVLADFAAVRASEAVLDAGCGYGGSALWLAKNVGCRVVGVTLVPAQVREAQRSAERQGVARLLRFERMDFTQTAFADASFDVVWALESVVHTGRKHEFVREAARLLRPGGRLLLAEYMLREQPPLTPEERASLAPWLAGWAMPSLYSVSEYSALLEACGFGSVQARDITEHVRPSVNRLGKLRLPTLPTASVFARVAQVLCALGRHPRERLWNIEAGICQNKALRLGLWHYIILRAIRGEGGRATF